MNRPSLQVAFFTAQADPRTCALSPVQDDFLRGLAIATGATAVAGNFPFTANPPPWRRRPLWREVISVTRQYRASRRPEFAARHRPAVLALLTRADETVLLAGSCGLELLRRLHLPEDAWARLSCIAYGAVAQQRPP